MKKQQQAPKAISLGELSAEPSQPSRINASGDCYHLHIYPHGGNSYDIEKSRIATPEQQLWWVKHLLKKSNVEKRDVIDLLEAIENDKKARLDMTQQLAQAARTIRHCGDYGFLFYNEKQSRVWWSAGDGDCTPLAGHSSAEEVTRKLKLPGINQVEVEAEGDPEEGQGWEQIPAPSWRNHHGVGINFDGYIDEAHEPAMVEWKEGYRLVKTEGRYGNSSLQICYAKKNKKGEWLLYSFYDRALHKYTTKGKPLSANACNVLGMGDLPSNFENFGDLRDNILQEAIEGVDNELKGQLLKV